MLLNILVTLIIAWSYCKIILGAYDSSPMQFHPSGRILQLEYAKDATKKGAPIAGLRCKDGVLIVAARRLPYPKCQAKPPRKLFRVDDHIFLGATGLLSDASALADIAESICRSYKSTYESPIPLENLCDELASLFHRQTRSASSRPLGISILVAGWDEELGPQLYEVDPEGSVTAWNAACAGKGADKIMDALSSSFEKKKKSSTMSLSPDNTVAMNWPHFKAILQQHLPHTRRELSGDLDFTAKPSHGLPVAISDDDDSATGDRRRSSRNTEEEDENEDDESNDRRSEEEGGSQSSSTDTSISSSRGMHQYSSGTRRSNKERNTVSVSEPISTSTSSTSNGATTKNHHKLDSSGAQHNISPDTYNNNESNNNKVLATDDDEDIDTPQWDLEVLTIMRTSDNRLSWSIVDQ